MRLWDLYEASVLDPSVERTISPTMIIPDLVNSDSYKQYRYLVALAAVRAHENENIPFDLESAWNESLAAVAYTDVDKETIEMTNRLMNVSGVMISSTKSSETNDTHKVSPVAKFTMFDNMMESVADISRLRDLIENWHESSEDQSVDIIKRPYWITQIKSIDPAIWTNNQVKKTVIKYLLDGMQSDDVQYMFRAVELFEYLKKKGCPWPELTVLESYVQNLVKDIMKDPHMAFNYADKVLKSPWPQAEPYIMQDPVSAISYAIYVLKRPWPEAEQIINTNAGLAGAYSDFVDEFNNKKNA